VLSICWMLARMNPPLNRSDDRFTTLEISIHWGVLGSSGTDDSP
jgi:hypothetical protein